MPYKLLLVDDEKDVTDTLGSRLSREGYTVSCASDGDEALVKIKTDDPDIILLDLALPKRNGFEVLKEVRENYKDRWRPVIIVSGQKELETVRKCYGMEADHYLTKPCTIDTVLRAIRTMISLIPARKEV